MLLHERGLLRAPVRQVVIQPVARSQYLFWVYGVNRHGRAITPKQRVQSRAQAEIRAATLGSQLGGVPVMWRAEPLEENMPILCPSIPCPDDLQPVQGQDGRFYRNACWARLAGNTSWGEVSVYAYSTATGPEPALRHPAKTAITGPQPVRAEDHAAFGGGARMNEPGYTGTGTVTRPNPTKEYQAWAQASAAPSKAAWLEHAKRLGMDPEDIESGWAAAHTSPKLREAISRLREVLGENTYSMYGGYSVPNPLMIKTPQGGGGDTNPGGGFPFRTRAAERVWHKALALLPEMEKHTASAIIDRVLEDESIPAYELTPEDMATLEIAINWAQAGKIAQPEPPSNNNRLGGAPGGPARSNREGHYLGTKGAP
jgi:hypothetical protein